MHAELKPGHALQEEDLAELRVAPAEEIPDEEGVRREEEPEALLLSSSWNEDSST